MWALGRAAALALFFAVFVTMAEVLTDTVHAAPLVAALTLGALAVALVSAARPLRLVAAMDARSRLLARVAGVLLVFGAPACLALLRASDTPTGSVFVFWISGGWALVAALAAAVVAWRSGRRPAAWLALAGGLAAAAGAAGIVANWEQPSSFSPMAYAWEPELLIIGAGALALAGAVLLVKAAHGGRPDGALVCATASGAVVALAWWVLDGLSAGWISLNERPEQVMIAALAWGVVCLLLPRSIDSEGLARGGALLALPPLLIIALGPLERLVGLFGPDPMIAGGVTAGAIVLAAGAAGLWWAGGREERPAPATPPTLLRIVLTWLALVPLAVALVALALPAVTASWSVDVSGGVGKYAGSLTLQGWQSVAGLAALGLAALAAALARADRPAPAAAVALAACVAWPSLLGVPMRVNTFLAPEIEKYYGTEYGWIRFSAIENVWMAGAVILAASVLVILIAISLMRSAGLMAGAKNER
jgi:hypothetical protein